MDNPSLLERMIWSLMNNGHFYIAQILAGIFGSKSSYKPLPPPKIIKVKISNK